MPKRKEPEVRRVPSQARSQERLERIQDSAAEVFAEVGFDAATMEGIAARADTSIGSVYQFFPNKRALLYAIAIRYAERMQRLFDEIVDGVSDGASWEALLDRSIDALVDFHRREPGFRALVRNWSSQEFLAQDEASTREFTRRTEALIADRFPGLDEGRRGVIATVLVESISALLITTSRRDPRRAPVVVEEWKAMLRRWLEPYATSARRPRSRAAQPESPSKAGSRRAPRPRARSSS